jgi:SOS-response transcriptional repressor LexA
MKTTTLNQKVFDFIVKYHADEDNIPTIKAISEGMGWIFSTNAAYHLRKLVKLGMLEKRGVNYRFPRTKPEDVA